MADEGALEDGLVDFCAYCVSISWANQVEAVYPPEDTCDQMSSLRWSEQVEEAERYGQL